MVMKGLSLRVKVTLLVLAATCAALCVAAASMVVYELRTYRTGLIQDLEGQADVVALASSAALAFDDPESAHRTLFSLRARQGITAAVLYQRDGRVFALYGSPAAGLPSVPPARESVFVGSNDIRLYKPIRDNTGPLGTIYLQARYDRGDRLLNYFVILSGVMAMSLGIALLISIWLQRVVTRPVLSVAETARHVMETGDFSLRAPRITHDELGALADDFNQMLTHIETDAGMLQQSNLRLQQEVAERKAAEDALRAEDRRKDEFLAMLGHELRNPLAAISMALHVGRSPNAGTDVISHSRAVIERQIQHLSRLVDDLLDVSRVITGKIVLNRAPLDVAEALEHAIEGLRTSGRLGSRPVVKNLQPAWVEADSTRLEQVFGNLLTNAIKYAPPEAPIEVSVERVQDRVVVRIRDSGIGIEPQLLPRIFELFVQGERSLDRSEGGLGIGLTLVKRLVEMHGGTVNAESEGSGRGSTFTVRLPALEGAAVEAGATPARTAVPPRRILVIEDNADSASMMQAYLSIRGHEVRVATNGLAGVELALEWQPQVALVDIGLPVLNGYQVAARLRTVLAADRLLLVAVSGYGARQDQAHALQSGFDHYLVKPVELGQLDRLIATAPAGASHAAASENAG
jgi:signal transduction histidine kinase/CheY-like chemotaxis protein